MTKTSILIIVINNVFCKHQVTDPVRKIKDKLKIINFSPQKNYMTLNNQASICRSMIMNLLKRNSHISLKFRLKMERAFPINKMLSKWIRIWAQMQQYVKTKLLKKKFRINNNLRLKITHCCSRTKFQRKKQFTNLNTPLSRAANPCFLFQKA